jgi:hypothetical protein
MMDGMSLEKLLAMLKLGPNPVPMGGSENSLGELQSMITPPPGGAGPGGASPFAAEGGQAAGLLAEAAGGMDPAMLDTGQTPIDLSAPAGSNEFNMVNQPGGGGPLAQSGEQPFMSDADRMLIAKSLMSMGNRSGVAGAGDKLDLGKGTGSVKAPLLSAGTTHTTGGPGPDFAAMMRLLSGSGGSFSPGFTAGSGNYVPTSYRSRKRRAAGY